MTTLVEILDTTLREGEQQADVRFAAQDKIAILHLLEDFGIRLVEVGHPGISAEDERVCREVAAAARRAQVLMHARANIEEIRAVERAGAQWVGIWAPVNELATETKFVGWSIEAIIQQIRVAVATAKDLGLRVRFTIEDASRTDWDRLALAAHAAIEVGADRISLADTVGVLEPSSCTRLVSRAVAEFAAEIEVHCHNDLGLALANTCAAIDAGAKVVDASILGIGERAGITDLLQLCVLLTQRREDRRFACDRCMDLANAVSLVTGYRPDELRPISGRYVFTHSSAYHVKAVKRNPEAYEPYPPEAVGQHRTISSGRPELKPPRLPVHMRVGRPFAKEASELRYHRNGPGTRWVLLDSRVDERASFYVMQRFIGSDLAPGKNEGHIDSHRHHCDSAFVFLGTSKSKEGLRCSVQLDDEEMIVESPATIFIPAGTVHSYRYVDGEGTVLNIVLAEDYNASLIEENRD